MGLLPNYFKRIGLFVALLSIVTQIAIIVLLADLSLSQKELIKEIFRSAFTIGLFFIAYSREKIEDEMNYYIRVKAMALTLLFVIISGILNPIIYYVFKEAPSIHANQEFVITVIVQYMITYQVIKWMKK